jgi:small conductance mechanosensitive channel
LYFVVLVSVLGMLGIPITSLVAILSIAGLAFSLAIQGSLSNLAGGKKS